MLADERKINVRPWLYRIARNRCLNHLRRPVHEGQDSMDIHPHMNGATTAERVQDREELRQVLNDVGTLPETQRTALLLREIDQMSYDEIAVAMETTIPAVKSLLVRARITLAESSEARTLSCDEVRVTLAEAAEGLCKASGPVRLHVRNCESCAGFRKQLRSDHKALAAILPLGPLAILKASFIGKLFGGGAAGSGAGAAGAVGGGAATGGAATGLGSVGAIGGAIGAKAVAGVATAALLTAGAVEVRHITRDRTEPEPRMAQAPVSDTPTQPPHTNVDERAASFSGTLAVAAENAGATTPVKVEKDAAAQRHRDEPTDAVTPPPADTDVVPVTDPVVTDPAVTDPATDTTTDTTTDETTTTVVVEEPTDEIDRTDDTDTSTTDGGTTTTPGTEPEATTPPPPSTPAAPEVTTPPAAAPVSPGE
jgi:hypothetical protein